MAKSKLSDYQIACCALLHLGLPNAEANDVIQLVKMQDGRDLSNNRGAIHKARYDLTKGKGGYRPEREEDNPFYSGGTAPYLKSPGPMNTDQLKSALVNKEVAGVEYNAAPEPSIEEGIRLVKSIREQIAELERQGKEALLRVRTQLEKQVRQLVQYGIVDPLVTIEELMEQLEKPAEQTTKKKS